MFDTGRVVAYQKTRPHAPISTLRLKLRGPANNHSRRRDRVKLRPLRPVGPAFSVMAAARGQGQAPHQVALVSPADQNTATGSFHFSRVSKLHDAHRPLFLSDIFFWNSVDLHIHTPNWCVCVCNIQRQSTARDALTLKQRRGWRHQRALAALPVPVVSPALDDRSRGVELNDAEMRTCH